MQLKNDYACLQILRIKLSKSKLNVTSLKLVNSISFIMKWLYFYSIWVEHLMNAHIRLNKSSHECREGNDGIHISTAAAKVWLTMPPNFTNEQTDYNTQSCIEAVVINQIKYGFRCGVQVTQGRRAGLAFPLNSANKIWGKINHKLAPK